MVKNIVDNVIEYKKEEQRKEQEKILESEREKKRLEQEKLELEKRLKEEEESKIAEEKRKLEEKIKFEEEQRKLEEKRKQEEEKIKAEEEQRKIEELQRKVDEQREEIKKNEESLENNKKHKNEDDFIGNLEIDEQIKPKIIEKQMENEEKKTVNNNKEISEIKKSKEIDENRPHMITNESIENIKRQSKLKNSMNFNNHNKQSKSRRERYGLSETDPFAEKSPEKKQISRPMIGTEAKKSSEKLQKQSESSFKKEPLTPLNQKQDIQNNDEYSTKIQETPLSPPQDSISPIEKPRNSNSSKNLQNIFKLAEPVKTPDPIKAEEIFQSPPFIDSPQNIKVAENEDYKLGDLDITETANETKEFNLTKDEPSTLDKVRQSDYNLRVSDVFEESKDKYIVKTETIKKHRILMNPARKSQKDTHLRSTKKAEMPVPNENFEYPKNLRPRQEIITENKHELRVTNSVVDITCETFIEKKLDKFRDYVNENANCIIF